MSWRETTPQETQDDLDRLLDAALPFAESELRQHGELYPYALAVDLEGQVRSFAADPDEGEHPESELVLTLLVTGLRLQAAELRATAFVTDVRVDAGEAIRVELEHRDGTALGVLVPYDLTDGELVVGGPHAFPGSPLVWDHEPHPIDGAAIEAAINEAERAFIDGDHAAVIEPAAIVLGDAVALALLREAAPEVAVVLAYQGAVSKLTIGDPSGAREWLRLVADWPQCAGAERRLLAQLELTEGNFDAVARLLDTGPAAAPMDLAIATAAAGYQRDHERVLSLGSAARAAAAQDLSMHPWDRAGVNVLVGLALVEVGEGGHARQAATDVHDLTTDAPPHVPLVAQRWLIEAAGRRLSGDLDGARKALAEAGALLPADNNCDRGLVQREAARQARGAGDERAAANTFAAAIATLRDAGETWLAADAEIEARTTPR